MLLLKKVPGVLQPWSLLSLWCSSSGSFEYFHRIVLVAFVVIIVVFLCTLVPSANRRLLRSYSSVFTPLHKTICKLVFFKYHNTKVMRLQQLCEWHRLFLVVVKLAYSRTSMWSWYSGKGKASPYAYVFVHTNIDFFAVFQWYYSKIKYYFAGCAIIQLLARAIKSN